MPFFSEITAVQLYGVTFIQNNIQSAGQMS